MSSHRRLFRVSSLEVVVETFWPAHITTGGSLKSFDEAWIVYPGNRLRIVHSTRWKRRAVGTSRRAATSPACGGASGTRPSSGIGGLRIFALQLPAQDCVGREVGPGRSTVGDLHVVFFGRICK